MKQPKTPESIIIVGAGVVGIACAYYLRRAGLDVTVIEKARVAGACSRSNCGYITPSHVPPLTEPGAIGTALKSLFNPSSPFRVKPSFNPAVWNWMWQFARRCNHQQVLFAGQHLQNILDASMEEYHGLIDREAFECEWKENGLLYVFESEKGLDEYGKIDSMLTQNFDVSAVQITADQLPQFEPGLKPGLAGAFHYPGDTSVRPDLLNQQWIDRISNLGVELIEECQLDSVVSSKGKIVSLSTSNGDFAADAYLFAMGAWSTNWAKQLDCQIPIQPGKGYSVTMNRPEHCPTYPMLFPERKVGVSPFDEGMRLGSMMEFVGFDESIPETRIQQLRDSARPYLRADVDGPANEIWYGWRPMTWDSLPIIGRTPRLSNAFLATGHNMLGLSLAPGTGRLITDIITQQDPFIDPLPFCIERFNSSPRQLLAGATQK